MTKTNERTQRLIGMILSDLTTKLDHFEYHIENAESRWRYGGDNDLWTDSDFVKALEIVSNLVDREANRNKSRAEGYWLENVKEA